ncbi:MAG: hypothetical protein PHS86_03210 [Syntrophaceae bacterium]|nr:hypothetical protein [Syntrophaceae bacterium]
METAYQASTVELDSAGYEDLQTQIINNKGAKPDLDGDIRNKPATKETTKEAPPASKKYVFKKGDQSLEVDEDYEIEFMADKRPTKLTLRELKDRAAGDIAVKNRMHTLAEEKKRVQGTFKKFTEIAKTDPLGALEYISQQARESDSEFEYRQYIEKLAEQAEKLGQMDEKERKAWELEKKLAKAEQDLSHKERTQAVVLRKQEMQSDYPEIGDQQFGQMVDAILSNEELMEGINNEGEVMDKVEELIQETLTQRDIITVIREINPAYVGDNELIFSLSDQLRQNPDFDEEDVRDILRDLIGKPNEQRTQQSQRERDIQTLSSKARMATPKEDIRMQNSTPYQLLEQQLLERRNEMRKTPLYKR